MVYGAVPFGDGGEPTFLPKWWVRSTNIGRCLASSCCLPGGMFARGWPPVGPGAEKTGLTRSIMYTGRLVLVYWLWIAMVPDGQ